jgi:hypothetical protein
MNRSERRYEVGLSAAVVAVFAAFWLIAVATSDPLEYPSQYVISAVMVALLATPWVFAVRLLWRAWRARTGAGRATMDGSARLLAAAAAALPAGRRQWGAAMSAELTQVRGRSARWRFAAGCARAAMLPARDSRVPMLAAGSLAGAAVVITALAVGQALPSMRVFAVTFVALAGAMATVAVSRPHPLRQAGSGALLTTTTLGGVAACIAVTAYFLVEHPTAAEHLPPATAVVFAVVLAGCLGMALWPPRVLTTPVSTSRLARGLGAAAALTLGIGCLAASRLTYDALGGTLLWVMFAPVLISFAASALAAALGRSFRAGVQAAVWTALVGALLVFVIGVLESLHRYGIDAQLLLDGDGGHPIGVNLGDAVSTLIAIPALGLPFGVIGAALGAKWARPSKAERGAAAPLSE